jgi:hypothetical protein
VAAPLAGAVCFCAARERSINPVRRWFGFCPTATAFSSDVRNCTHEFPKSGATAQGGFG